MICPKCGSNKIGITYRYGGTFYIDQNGTQNSDDLYPIATSKYWRCMDCGKKIKEAENED